MSPTEQACTSIRKLAALDRSPQLLVEQPHCSLYLAYTYTGLGPRTMLCIPAGFPNFNACYLGSDQCPHGGPWRPMEAGQRRLPAQSRKRGWSGRGCGFPDGLGRIFIPKDGLTPVPSTP